MKKNMIDLFSMSVARRGVRRSSILVTILLLASTFIVLFTGSVVGDSGGNDSFDSAEMLPANMTAHGMVNASNDMNDYYAIPVGQGVLIEISAQCLQNSSGTLSVTLYDSTRSQIGQVNDLDPGGSGNIRFLTALEDTSDFFVMATENIGSNTTYRIEVILTDQDDAGTGSDAAGDQGSPQAIVQGDGYLGELNDADLQDRYLLNVPQGSYLQVDFTTVDTGPIEMNIRDQTTAINHDTGWVGSGGSASSQILLDENFGGDFTIRFNGKGNYSFSMTVSPQNDTGDGTDAPGQQPGTENIVINDTIEGMIGSFDEMDSFRFSMVYGTGFLLNISHDLVGADLVLGLLDDNGNSFGNNIYIAQGSVTRISYWSDVDDTRGISGFSILKNSNQDVINYSVETVVLEKDDAGTGTDVHGSGQQNQLGHPFPLGNASFEGGVGIGVQGIDGDFGDVRDRYRFEVPPYNDLTVKAMTSTPDVYFSLNFWDETWINEDHGFDINNTLDWVWSNDYQWRNFTFEVMLDRGARGNYSIDIMIEEVPDTTPPLLTVNSHPDDPVQDPNIEIRVSANDEMGIDRVELILNDNMTIECSDVGWEEFNCIVKLEVGENKLDIRAIDINGNMANEILHYNYTLGELILMINEPFEGQEFNSDMVYISGGLSGAYGDERVQISTDGGNTWMDANKGHDKWDMQVQLQKGTNEIIVWAWDDKGREDKQTVTVTYVDNSGNGNGGSGNGGNGGGNGGNGGGGGGPNNMMDFFLLMGVAYCINPIVLALFIGGILAGMLPLYIGLRIGIRGRRIKAAKEEMEEGDEDEPPQEGPAFVEDEPRYPDEEGKE